MRSHLLLSELPITSWGTNRAGLCGTWVLGAEVAMMVDLSQRGMPDFDANTLRDCPKCIELAEHDSRLLNDLGAPGWSPKRLYLYVILPGQERMAGAREWPERDEQYTGTCISGLVEAVEKAEGK